MWRGYGTAVTIDAEVLRQGQARAKEAGLSWAEYCRQLVRTDLERDGRAAGPAPWSPTDVGILKQGLVRDHPIEFIAAFLRREPKEVAKKAKTLARSRKLH